MGRVSTWSLFFLFQVGLAWGQSSSTIRYEGRLSGPAVPTNGTLTAQIFRVSLRHPNCLAAGELGVSPWTSNTVSITNGAFSLNPNFDSAQLALALSPGNTFAGVCPAGDGRRQLVIEWQTQSETFYIDLDDAPRATYAMISSDSKSTDSLRGVPLHPTLSTGCTAGSFLRFNSGMGQMECLPLAQADIPLLAPAQIPNLAGDVTGTISTNSVERIRGVNVSSATPAANQVLKLIDGAWTPSPDAVGAPQPDASYTVKGIVQVDSSAAVSGLNLTAGVLSLPDLISAGGVGSAQTIPVIAYDAKGRLTTVTGATVDDNSKLPLAGGNMNGNINMNAVNSINNINRVGIGLANPTEKLEIWAEDSDSEIKILNTRSTASRKVGVRAMNFVISGGGPAPAVSFEGVTARGSAASPAQTQANDVALEIAGLGIDSVATPRPLGAIQVAAESSVSASTAPGSIRFLTTSIGNPSPTEKMRISPAGNVGIGTTSPSASLHVEGTIRLGAAGSPFTNVILCSSTNLATLNATQSFSCPGVHSGSTCSCQWHTSNPPADIRAVIPGSGLLTLIMSGAVTILPGEIRCICYNPPL